MSSDPPDGEPLAVFEIDESIHPPKKWELALYADYLRLESPAGKRHHVEWADRAERLETFDRALLRRMLVVKLSSKKVIFRLSPDAFAALRAWIGPPTVEDLKASLKRQFTWVVPVGVLFVLTSAPIGDLPFEPVTFGLGLALILTGLLSRVWPHRVFFALDALWFCFLAANSIYQLADLWRWMTFAFLVVQLLLAWRAFQEFHRFAPNRMTPAADAETDDPAAR